MINSFKIENFTVFKEVIFQFCDGINVIIGENGSGKTHLLKLLNCLCDHTIFNQTAIQLSIDTKEEQEIDLGVLPFKLSRSYFQEDCVFASTTGDAIVSMFDNTFPTNREIKEKYNDSQSLVLRVPTKVIYDALLIPAKEMLSMAAILKVNGRYSKELKFDKTLIDIMKKAQHLKPDNIPELAQKISKKIEKVIDGTIFVKEDNSFWVRKNCGLEIPFSMEAEGLRKFGLLWQLLMNESITKNTILLWDEPEANLNPQIYSVLVDILLELSQNGVQIFLATHSYDLTKFIDVKKQKTDHVLFHSLYKTSNGIQCESAEGYQALEHNSIESGAAELYNAIIAQDIEAISNE